MHFYCILEREMLQTKMVVKIETHFMCSVTIFRKIVPFMRQCEKNTVEWDRPQMTTWRMRTTCCIPKATNTQTRVV